MVSKIQISTHVCVIKLFENIQQKYYYGVLIIIKIVLHSDSINMSLIIYSIFIELYKLVFILYLSRLSHI